MYYVELLSLWITVCFFIGGVSKANRGVRLPLTGPAEPGEWVGPPIGIRIRLPGRLTVIEIAGPAQTAGRPIKVRIG